MTERQSVLSGMRPTGALHLGHLVGALESWAKMQDTYDCYFFVADIHALTSEYAAPQSIPDVGLENVACFLAAGVDPERSTLFVQSDVPEHAELAILLSMITPLGWLERVPSYKEQQQQIRNKDLGTYGFLGYPVLQAADVLIYRASFVPVGEDQVAHLELTREIARRFNHLYGETFPEPAPLLSPAPRLPGTDGRKMSNSYGNSIGLGDDTETVWNTLRGAVTDPARKRREDPGNPFICPLYHTHKIFSAESTVQQIERECVTAELGCVACKKMLGENIEQRLGPIRERRREYLSKPDKLREILREGARKARAVADRTMREVREKMGLDPDGPVAMPPR